MHLQGGDGGQKIVLNQKPENITTTTTTTTTTPAPESDQDDDGGSSFGVSTRGSPDEFTFQAILTATGDIYFAYKSVPIVINSIEDAEHPVKVGLSDAYIIDRTIFCKWGRIMVETTDMGLVLLYVPVQLSHEEVPKATRQPSCMFRDVCGNYFFFLLACLLLSRPSQDHLRVPPGQLEERGHREQHGHLLPRSLNLQQEEVVRTVPG